MTAETAHAVLRERAEELLRRTRNDIRKMSPEDVAELFYELQVHQIELSMQNDELRRTQEELDASHRKYYDLYDFAPVGYITLDKAGTILEANLMAGTLLGKPRSELSGKKFSEFVHSDSQDGYYLHYRKVFRVPTQQNCQIQLKEQCGDKFLQLQSLMVAGDEDCCRTAISDITALKRLEMEALAASEAKSSFLANISHEIRTPLSAIIGLTRLLGKSEPLTAAQMKFINTLQLSSDSLLELINGVLDITKIEAGIIELEHIPFHFPDLLGEATSIVKTKAKEKGLELAIDIDSGLHPAYYGDPLRIRQIVLNLLSNAIKFTQKGRVALRVRGTFENNERMNVVIDVSDTGIGIPKEKQAEIFNVFTQAESSTARKFGGSGLGLAICKKLAERMQGTISVDSAPGRGSTFTLRMPLKINPNLAKPKKSLEVRPVKGEILHILLVEDNPTNTLIATTYLDELHCTYDTASSGEEALRKFKENRYSFILMDVQMQNMDGYEATRRIRLMEKQKALPETPIIALTAHALQGDKKKCLAAGMNDYLTKPLRFEEISEKLEEYA
ncbi:MAG: response regulator [Alphaproteobacteria bacterium]|nr:response regulator [Alphaproteobacteria bacterium]